jgi:hypothetical protein
MASFKEYLNQLCFDCISRLFERKCGADLSWYRFVLVPNCLFQRVPKCLGAEPVSRSSKSWARCLTYPGQ